MAATKMSPKKKNGVAEASFSVHRVSMPKNASKFVAELVKLIFVEDQQTAESKDANEGQQLSRLQAILNDRFGPHWHCVMGLSLGFALKNHKQNMGMYWIGKRLLIVYKSPVHEFVGADAYLVSRNLKLPFREAHKLLKAFCVRGGDRESLAEAPRPTGHVLEVTEVIMDGRHLAETDLDAEEKHMEENGSKSGDFCMAQNSEHVNVSAALGAIMLWAKTLDRSAAERQKETRQEGVPQRGEAHGEMPSGAPENSEKETGERQKDHQPNGPCSLSQDIRKYLTASTGPIWHVLVGKDFACAIARNAQLKLTVRCRYEDTAGTKEEFKIVCYRHSTKKSSVLRESLSYFPIVLATMIPLFFIFRPRVCRMVLPHLSQSQRNFFAELLRRTCEEGSSEAVVLGRFEWFVAKLSDGVAKWGPAAALFVMLWRIYMKMRKRIVS